jgi:hypothetical protein
MSGVVKGERLWAESQPGAGPAGDVSVTDR